MTIDLCYILSSGFSTRMVLHGGLISQLKNQGLKVAVLLPDADERLLRALEQEYGITFVAAERPSARRQYEYLRIRRYLEEDVTKNPNLWAWHLRELCDSPSVVRRTEALANLLVNQVACRAGIVRRALAAFEARVFLRHEPSQKVIERLQPRALACTYPIDPVEACLLHEAKRAGVTTVCHLLSWDNLSTKGRFPVIADHFISWGPVMSEEIREYCKVPTNRIAECGVPHFDTHRAQVSQEARDKLIKSLGLNSALPYLFYGTNPAKYSPCEIQVVEWLAREVERDTFGKTMQLIVRPHPQGLQGYMADESWRARLVALQSRRVGLNFPRFEQGSLDWNLSRGDLLDMGNLIAGCAVSINAGSTLALDSVLHDRPVVLAMFDADEKIPWRKSITKDISARHLAKAISFGGMRLTRSFPELSTAIRRYLADPRLDARERAETVRREVGVFDGRSALRIAEAYAEWLRMPAIERDRTDVRDPVGPVARTS